MAIPIRKTWFKPRFPKRHKFHVPVSELVGNATLEVNITGLQAFKLRLWLAHKIIKILEWVVRPIKVEVRE